MRARHFHFVVGVSLAGFLCAAPVAHGQDRLEGEPGKAAAEFINAYVAVSLKPQGNTMAFVKASPAVTGKFKRDLDKLYSDALRTDPELGYGADAVIGGQDCPERFRVKNCRVDGGRARVVLIGEDPDFPMEVRVLLVREGARWLIDASGDLVRE